MEPPLKSGELPAFCNPDAAAPYPGGDEAPTFDDELDDLFSEDVTPAGQGPSRGYQERWRSIARFHALNLTNNQIARKLGYTPHRVSMILKHPWIIEQVRKYREAFDADISSRVKEAASDGIDLIHQTILNEREKTSSRLEAAKFAVEKAHGKARQEVHVESGTLASFMDLLKEMKTRGEPLDVTPVQLTAPALAGPEEAASPVDAWLSTNLR